MTRQHLAAGHHADLQWLRKGLQVDGEVEPLLGIAAEFELAPVMDHWVQWRAEIRRRRVSPLRVARRRVRRGYSGSP